MATEEIFVPDIGDFEDVPVIEIHVDPGSSISKEQAILTLESDKATVDVPCPCDGVIEAILVGIGDKVKKGTLIARVQRPTGEGEGGDEKAKKDEGGGGGAAGLGFKSASPTPKSSTAKLPDADQSTKLLVLGAGPGGYTAAFRAADLGVETTLVERWPQLGGVCLNVGCIPSKALLHAAKVITEAEEMAELGVKFAAPKIDLDALRGWKDDVVGKLTGGLGGLAKKRKVNVVKGTGKFLGPNLVEVEGPDGDKTTIAFENAIVAAGSEPVRLPFFPEDERVIDSTGALELKDIPKRLLVVGGGIIGMEMACVYDALGSKVTVVELMDGLMPGADRDIVKPLQKRLEKRLESIKLKTKVTACEAKKKGLEVTFEDTDGQTDKASFDKVLVAVGRTPNGKRIGLENTGVAVDERGYVPTDKQMRTNVEHIFAIGDIVGQPMLAHKATHEGKVAAEVVAGEKSFFDARVIPSVAYTDPEIAWVGLTETEAKAKGTKFEKGSFPWAASGRSLGMARSEGLTKVLFDPETHQVLGAGIVGTSAGDLIAEICLAIEMGAEAGDIGLTIHPHPTLSETVAMSAEAYEGTITDLYVPKRK